MQTEHDGKCVAKNVDRLSDGVVVGNQIEPAGRATKLVALSDKLATWSAKLAVWGAKLVVLGAKLAVLGAKLAALGSTLAIWDTKLAALGRFGEQVGRQQAGLSSLS